MSRVRRASFVVRVVEDGRGQVSGVIERVATGAKEAFTGMEAIGRVITRMLQGARALPRAGSATPTSELTPARKTLLVAQSAVPGHLGYGDSLGACPQ